MSQPPAPTVHHHLTHFLWSQMSLGDCRAPRPQEDNKSRAHVIRLSQVTGQIGEATCPKPPRGVKQSQDSRQVSDSPASVLSPLRLPVSPEGSPNTPELHLRHSLLSAPPSPMISWVGPTRSLQRGEGGLTCLLLGQYTRHALGPCAPTAEMSALGGFALSFAVSFLPALDWRSENLPLWWLIHFFRPSFSKSSLCPSCM